MYRFAGPVSMDTASAALADCVRAIDGGEGDFALDGLEHSDSSSLSVLLGALRHARGRGRALTFRGMPPKLRSLAALYGVDALLAEPATA